MALSLDILHPLIKIESYLHLKEKAYQYSFTSSHRTDISFQTL